MAGVHPVTFWLANLIWDFLLYLVVLALVLVTLCLLDERSLFTEPVGWTALLLIFGLYGWGAILMSYVFSNFTKSAPAASALFTLFSMLCGKQIHFSE